MIISACLLPFVLSMARSGVSIWLFTIALQRVEGGGGGDHTAPCSNNQELMARCAEVSAECCDQPSEFCRLVNVYAYHRAEEGCESLCCRYLLLIYPKWLVSTLVQQWHAHPLQRGLRDRTACGAVHLQ